MLTILLLAACGGGGDATAGAEIYDSTCASCHGDDGAAGVETNGVPATDLNDEVPDSSDAELKDVIQNGEGEMGPQGLDDTETDDVIAYLRETFG